MSTGIIEKRLNRALAPIDKFFNNHDYHDPYFREISLNNLVGSFKVILIIWSISLIILVLEIMFYFLNYYFGM